MPLTSLLAFLVLYSAYTLAVETPPRITQPPTVIPEMQVADRMYFIDDGERRKDLPCRAIGSKPIRFEWTKNGEILNISDPKYLSSNGESRIIRVSEGTGTLLISELKKEDEGIYQCKATNNYGTSLSKKLQLVKATIGIFKDKDKDAKRYPVIPANSLKVTCNPPESDPPGKTKWVRYIKDETDTISVDLDDRVAVDDDGNLYFANIQQTDDNFQEKYACLTNIMELSVYTEGAYSYIEVLDGDPTAQFPAELKYFTAPDNIIGLKGKSASFKCIFGGNPTPQIEWVRVGGELVTSRMQIYNQELLVRGIEFADAGIYECRGKNSLSSQPQTHRFTLEVHARPEWSAEPQPVNAGVEEKAVFECAAEGKPPAVINWFINGKPLESLMPDLRRTLSTGQLMFRNLTRDDAQVIQCNASNIHGYVWKDVALSILAFKPEIKIPLKKVKVAEGHSVVLPCDTDGKPTPTIYWKKGDVKLEGRRYYIHWKGNLTIDKVSHADEGPYTCFTENRYGKDSATGELLVRKKTTIHTPPFPLTQTISHGNRLHFTCGATTDSNERIRLKISWLKDGKPVNLKDPRISKTKDKGLLVTSVNSSDTGNYTCVASNGLDSDSKSAEVKVVAPPDPPYEVKVSSCRARSALITWKPGKDNFSPIIGYHVEYNHSYAPAEWTRAATVENPDVTEAKVVLSPHANYTFRVIAVNNLGESQPSQYSPVCESNPAKPDKHPTNVHTDRSKPGVLIIKWDQMTEIEHNAGNFKYVLVIKKDGKTNRTEISDWRENEKEINYNLVYSPFEIYIEAFNEKGTFSKPAVVHIGYTGEDKPAVAPANFEKVPGTNVTDKSAWFQWDAVDPSPESMRGEFHGYKIRFWKTDDPDNTLKAVMLTRNPPEDNRIKRENNRVKREVKKDKAMVKNLYPYSNVQLDIVAVNTYFESNGSNVINITTEEGVPGPVEYARVLSRGAHHFLLEWGKPKEPNGVLTGYEIGYEEVKSMQIGKYQNADQLDDPNETRYFLGGLTQTRDYRIYVRALTKEGKGEQYYIDAKTANPGPLLKPILKVDLIGEDYVNVTWTVGSNTDAPAGSVHYVKYRKTGDSEWAETERERTHSWMNVSGLIKATRYEMIVVASNGKVEQSSEKEEILTAGGAVAVEPVTSIATASWFIGMMVAIAVLILFLIIVCFIKRSRGEKYHVQEKERLRGTDPESANKDHFNEYAKNGEKEPLAAGSPDSFDNDTEKVVGGSETDSMAEYGDVDPSKFNEDGSFIGQYGDAKPTSEPNAPSAMSTFV